MTSLFLGVYLDLKIDTGVVNCSLKPLTKSLAKLKRCPSLEQVHWLSAILFIYGRLLLDPPVIIQRRDWVTEILPHGFWHC